MSFLIAFACLIVGMVKAPDHTPWWAWWALAAFYMLAGIESHLAALVKDAKAERAEKARLR